MATQPANLYSTLTAIGQREDLTDMIYNITPTETHFLSIANKNKTKAEAITHEWQTDTLADPSANAQPEGFEYVGEAATPTVRLTNRCQISQKSITVSKTLDAIKKAGRAKEFAYQIQKRATELKRDIEYTLTNPQTPQDETAVDSPRQLRDLTGWYSTNVSMGVGGQNGTTTAERVDGTPRALTENMFKTLMQSIFEAGGEPKTVLCRAVNKVKISGWAGNATRTIDAKDKRLVTNIDVYVSDFGEHKIVASYISRPEDVHILDERYWAMAWLRPMKMETPAETGDSNKAYHVAEYTLEARNEAASGLITDLTTS